MIIKFVSRKILESWNFYERIFGENGVDVVILLWLITSIAGIAEILDMPETRSYEHADSKDHCNVE